MHLQAYTNELELEVAHLMEENARLRSQQQQVKLGKWSSKIQKLKDPTCHIDFSHK